MIPHIWKLLISLIWFKRQHVGTIALIDKDSIYYNAERYATYIHCFESCWGHRWVKIIGHYNTSSRSIDLPTRLTDSAYFNKVKATEIYQIEIYPWLCGRNTKSIPSYKKVKSGKWDFIKNLKGQAAIVFGKSDEKT